MRKREERGRERGREREEEREEERGGERREERERGRERRGEKGRERRGERERSGDAASLTPVAPPTEQRMLTQCRENPAFVEFVAECEERTQGDE